MILTKKFEEHVYSFAVMHQLFIPSKKYVLALSGGIDSLALFYVLLNLKRFSFEVVHFNHGTRPENLIEESFIINLCKEHQINLKVFQLELKHLTSDFENQARIKRNEIYKKYISKRYYVILGHHIDDSYEWSMMQKSRQGRLKSTLGIPVFSNGIIRPFMCVTKAQIQIYAKKLNLTWFEDATNNNNKYDRNYLRLNIIPQIKLRYPQYLKHYVIQHNQLAYQLNCHQPTIANIDEILEVKDHFLSGFVLKSKNFELHRDEIVKIIIQLSDNQRGKLNSVIDQIIKTQQKIQQDPKFIKFHGPYSFTGDVQAYLFNNTIWLTKKKGIEEFKKYDKYIVSQIPYGLSFNSDISYFPNIFFFSTNEKITKNLRRSKINIPFLIESISALKKSDIPYFFSPLM